MEHFTQNTFKQKITSWVTLVDFYADRCGPCRILGKHIPHLSKKYEGIALVGKVNTEKEFAISQKYGIRSLPTVLVFKDWKEVERLTGLQPPEMYSAVIDKHLTS